MQKSLIVLALAGIASAGISTGQCPKPTLQANFNAAAYMGLWYE